MILRKGKQIFPKVSLVNQCVKEQFDGHRTIQKLLELVLDADLIATTPSAAAVRYHLSLMPDQTWLDVEFE